MDPGGGEGGGGFGKERKQAWGNLGAKDLHEDELNFVVNC